MKALSAGLVVGALLLPLAVAAQTPPFVTAKCDAVSVPTFENVRLPHAVLANGKTLAAGSYQVRITTDHPAAAIGQSPTGECWVEFLKGTDVAGRELASVVEAADVSAVAKGPAPGEGQSRVDALKGDEYVRVWLNSSGRHYIVNMPVAR